MSIANLLLGLLIISVGVVTIKFNYQIVNSFSRNNWFEQHLGAGSTYIVFKLLSLMAVLFGILFMFGLHDNILRFIFSPLINVLGGN